MNPNAGNIQNSAKRGKEAPATPKLSKEPAARTVEVKKAANLQAGERMEESMAARVLNDLYNEHMTALMDGIFAGKKMELAEVPHFSEQVRVWIELGEPGKDGAPTVRALCIQRHRLPPQRYTNPRRFSQAVGRLNHRAIGKGWVEVC